ncbi:MAG: c-type cytochrome [Bryobacteraceae bacterium]
MRIFAFLAAAVLAIPLATPQGRNPYGNQPDAIAKGKETYLGACSACHGVSGMGGQGPNLVTGRQISRLSDAQLFRSIHDGVKGTGMPPFPLPDEKVWQLVSFVRELSAPANRANLSGDPAAGRALFFGAAGCSRCHAIAGNGGALGPDLTNAGAARTAHHLRESILNPDERIASGYNAVTVVTRSGAELKGVARNQDGYSIQLLDAAGKLHLLTAAEWKEIRPVPGSLMPSGYGKRLTSAQIDDLVRFLSRQAIRGDSL